MKEHTMSASIVKIASQNATPQRLDGVVTEKNGLVTIEYKEKGMVKSKTASFPAADVIYQVGTPGLVIALSSAPVTQFVGEMKVKDGKMTVTTDAGTIVLNKLPGVSFDMSVVDPESREARVAERAGKVKVKLPRAAKQDKAEKTSKSRSERPSKEERIAAKKAAAAKAQKSAGKPSRTEAVVVKKKKKG